MLFSCHNKILNDGCFKLAVKKNDVLINKHYKIIKFGRKQTNTMMLKREKEDIIFDIKYKSSSYNFF